MTDTTGNAVTLGDGDDILITSSKIIGGVDMGGGNDTLTNKGAITGDVSLGNGDDKLTIVVGSNITGTIDGGAGDDTLALSGTGADTLGGTVTNVEKLVVESAAWTLAGTSDFSDVDVKGGATLTSGSSLLGSAAPGHLVIEAGGAITDTAVVTVQGTGSVVVDNSGTIERTWFDAGSSGSAAINNHVGGTITAGLNVRGNATIDNHGGISGGDDQLSVSLASAALMTLVNHEDGQITSEGSRDVIRIEGSVTDAVIENAGLIRANGNGQKPSDAIAFRGSDVAGGQVHNLAGGWIEGGHHAVSGKAGLTVVNDEGGTMIGRNGSAVNVDNNSDPANTVTVTNYGVMQGRSNGSQDSDGDAIDADGLAVIENWGSVKGLGANGFHKGEVNISEGIAIGGGSITNHAGATIYGYGRAIQVDDSSNGAAFAATVIVNDGTIQGDGHQAEGVGADHVNDVILTGREAVSLLGDWDDSLTNGATGKIVGGVDMGAGADTLTNAGTITATAGSAVNMGDGADTLSNSGKIVGTVLLGAGDDTVNIYAGSTSGTIDGGDGYDTIHAYAVPGSSTVGVVGASVNVEKLDIASGSWMLGYGFNGANIEVESGATITSGSAATAMGLTGGQTLTVDQGGLVVGTKFAIGISGGDVDAVVVNSGTIKVTSTPGTKADAITMNGGTATVHNTSTGYIEGARHAITGPLGVHVINDAGGIIVGRNGSAMNMDNSPIVAYTAYVDNYGTMLGESANIADSDGDAIDVDGFAVINNHGSVRGEGANGYHKGEANVSEGIAIGGGTINNYAGGNIYGYGRAIEVDNSSNGAAFSSTIINNAGIIEGGGHGPNGASDADVALFAARLKGGEAINIIGSYADTIVNTGGILGGVKTDGGDDTLTNSGLMVATGGSAVDLGAGNDTFTNSGIVSGDVLAGAGDDTINLVTGSTVSGTIDGGEGTDTINLSGTGNGTLGKATGVEKLDVRSGAWAINSDASYTNVTVESGAGLVVRGAATAVTVEQGATLSVYGSTGNTTVLGEQAIQAGGVATGTTIGAGGEQRVIGGASASDTTIEGGTQHVYGSADDTVIDAAGLQHVHGSATDTTVNSGGEQNVYASATATGTTVNAGGIQIDWGNAIATTIEGGSQYVYGTAADTVILSGTQYVEAGGATYGTMIGDGGTAHAFGGASVHNVTFAGADATLVLDQASDFSGFISGWQDGNHLDLSDIRFGEGSMTLLYLADVGHGRGTLTVSDGSHTASLALLGQYTAADFALSSDGHGGTMISDPGAGVQQSALALPHAA